jgi:hypothetical protein
VTEKWGLPTVETYRIIPSTTIIQGQNSSDIFQTSREIWDWFIEMEVDTFNGCQSFNFFQFLSASKSLHEKLIILPKLRLTFDYFILTFTDCVPYNTNLLTYESHLSRSLSTVFCFSSMSSRLE